MGETGGLWIVDGEDAGAGTPWEFAAIVLNGAQAFELSASAKANGSYGYRHTSDGANASTYGEKTFSQTNDLYVRGYLKISSGAKTNAAWQTVYMIRLSARIYFGVNADGSNDPIQWIYYGTSMDGTTSTTNFSLGAWHYVEIRALKHASAGGAQIWVDGTLVFDDIDQAWENDVTTYVVGGVDGRCFANGVTVDWDDIKADTSPVGAYSAAGGLSATAASILALADSAVLARSLSLSVVDGIALTAGAGGALRWSGAVSDGIALTAGAGGALAWAGTVSDGIALSAGAGGLLAWAGAVSDGIALSVGAGGSLAWAGAVTDGMILSDQGFFGGSIVVSVADGLVLADNAAALLTLLVSVSDGPIFQDTADGTATYSITVADGVSFSDAISAAMAMLATVTDNMALTDAVAEGTIATGRMQITITSKGASVTITSRQPGASVADKHAGMTIS